MARVIEEVFEKKRVRCNHCGKLIEYTLEDIWSSYDRGLDYSDGWIDADCIWNYITCPNCNQTISVDDNISQDDYKYLKDKFDNNW